MKSWDHHATDFISDSNCASFSIQEYWIAFLVASEMCTVINLWFEKIHSCMFLHVHTSVIKNLKQGSANLIFGGEYQRSGDGHMGLVGIIYPQGWQRFGRKFVTLWSWWSASASHSFIVSQLIYNKVHDPYLTNCWEWYGVYQPRPYFMKCHVAAMCAAWYTIFTRDNREQFSGKYHRVFFSFFQQVLLRIRAASSSHQKAWWQRERRILHLPVWLPQG